MSNELLDEYEQGEVVKKWIRENGPSIVFGIVLGVGGLFGWRYWQDFDLGQRTDAARGYDELVASLDGEGQATVSELEAFALEHGNAAYQALVSFHLAHKAVEELNLDEAARLFQVAAEKAEPKPLRHVAGLRMARVQLQAGLLDDALASVDRYDGAGFEGMAAEIRGDILLAKGERESARQSYEFAMDNLGTGGGDRNLLQMKIDDLTTSLPEPVAEAADPAETAETNETDNSSGEEGSS